MAQRAADLNQEPDQRGKRALFEIGPALWDAFFGDMPAARKSALPALQVSTDRDVEYGAAFALALSGESSQSQALAKDLETRFPEDTAVRVFYLPAIRALLQSKEERGLAYLGAKHGSEAAAEFQKVIDGRNIVVSDPIGALAHLQLGRALAMSGDIAKAKAAYQDFLTLWNSAEADIPILKQAKVEYAKL
jgi:tetratricopeptide (TPR) repeat protein